MKKTVKDKIKKIWRFPYKKYFQSKTRNSNVRILSSNCIGGLLYHDMGKSFDSPTINCTVKGMDFIDMCRDYDQYFRVAPVLAEVSPQGYPIADVNGIRVNCVHYKSIDEFSAIWERRCERFLTKDDVEIVVISCDDQIRTAEEIEAFHNLPYRKVCFTVNPEPKYPEFIYVPGYDGQESVGDLTRYADFTGKRIFQKYFDFIGFLNNKL